MSDDKTIMEVEVEDFGRVRHAALKVKPLTVLVGENNTGKSWLASLLWGIGRFGDLWLMGGADAMDEVVERLRERAEAAPTRIESDDQAWILQTFSRAMTASVSAIVQRTLGDAHIGRSSILLRRGTRHHLLVEASAASGGGGASWGSEPFRVRPPPRDAADATWRVFALDVAALVNRRTPRLRSPLYLPASRTGFVLMLETLVREGLDALGPSPPRPVLTAPMVAFSQWLATNPFNADNGKRSRLSSLLEEPTAGRYVVQRERINRLSFELHDGKRLPMQLTSSLVTELAPLALACGDLRAGEALIVEEPESHLHPAMQRTVTRVLARLVRRGVRVIVTTHSENIAQQLNNFIKLGSLSPDKRREAQQKLGYEDEDYLLADEVAGYELRVGEDGRSEAAELAVNAGGIEQPLLNEELRRLSQDTYYLRDLLDEEPGR